MVMGESVVVGSIVRNQWWEDRPVNGFRRMDGLAVAVGGCVGCGGWQRLCFDFGGFILFIYKVVLVDVGLCQWWLSALLQPRWLCRCCC